MNASHSRSSSWYTLVPIGVFVHFVLFAAIFHIYYSSPIVHGVDSYEPLADPPARRLVLFVADGLRAESFFDNMYQRAPFLTSLVAKNARFGISHTHVPTESRPGHVAMLAGFTEDVSAVTKGWTDNPVEFDTVLNRSRNAFAWGSPDIVPMFARGSAFNKVHAYSYSHEEEDFASKNAADLDRWVFDHVKAFMSNMSTITESAFRSNKLMLFLHLLGTDTNGHGFKPHSEEYLDNIAVNDHGIYEICKLIEEFYGYESRTTYMFTSDHGMTDWGSHGAGSSHETETPLIVWGAGVETTSLATSWTSLLKSDYASLSEKSFANEKQFLKPGWWKGLHSRQDVKQIDLAPLMASYMGVATPSNSLGILPMQYLRTNQRYQFYAARANFIQLQMLFNAKRREKYASSFKALFREFPGASPEHLRSIVQLIDDLAMQKRYKPAVDMCIETMPIFVDGIEYFHRYERTFQSYCIVAIFVSWIGIVFTSVKRNLKPSLYQPSNLAIATTFVVLLLLWLQSFAWPNYVYSLLPIFLIDYVRHLGSFSLMQILTLVHHSTPEQMLRLLKIDIIRLLKIIGGLIVIPILLALALTHREILSVALFLVALHPYWDFIYWEGASTRCKLTWTILSIINALYPMLPTVGKNHFSSQIVLLPLVLIVATIICFLLFNKNVDEPKTLKLWIIVSISSIFSHYMNDTALTAKKDISLIARTISWMTLFLPLPAIVFENALTHQRSIMIVLWLLLPFACTSMAHEVYFYVSFAGLLIVWCYVEHMKSGKSQECIWRKQFFHYRPVKKGSSKEQSMTVHDACRTATFYLIFAMYAFLGTGNVASLNSFDPSFVRLFVTQFKPWLMMALLIMKCLIPFVLLSLALVTIIHEREAPTSHVRDIILLVMILSDIITMVCFFKLRDTGSWLDIGESISHYILSMCMTMALSFLYYLVATLTKLRFESRRRNNLDLLN